MRWGGWGAFGGLRRCVDCTLAGPTTAARGEGATAPRSAEERGRERFRACGVGRRCMGRSVGPRNLAR